MWRPWQGQIGEIPNPGVRNLSAACGNYQRPGYLMWNGEVTFSVCLWARLPSCCSCPQPHPLPHSPPPLTHPAPSQTGGALWREMWSVRECQLVPWDLVRHLLAKWCLVILLKADGVADGTCCPREGEARGGGHYKMHFVTLNFTKCHFGVTITILMPVGWVLFIINILKYIILKAIGRVLIINYHH